MAVRPSLSLPRTTRSVSASLRQLDIGCVAEEARVPGETVEIKVQLVKACQAVEIADVGGGELDER